MQGLEKSCLVRFPHHGGRHLRDLHAAEFDLIHPPDVVEKYAPDAVIGALGDGGEEDDVDVDSSGGGDTMEEVTKHNKKGGVWVVLSNIERLRT